MKTAKKELTCEEAQEIGTTTNQIFFFIIFAIHVDQIPVVASLVGHIQIEFAWLAFFIWLIAAMINLARWDDWFYQKFPGVGRRQRDARK